MTFPWSPRMVALLVRTIFRRRLLCLSIALLAAPALAGTERFERSASRTGALYTITVITPDAPPPVGGYPVLYALDGTVTAPLIDAVRDEIADDDLRSTVLIGIGYGERDRSTTARRYHDLTPPTPAENLPPMRNGSPPPSTGGRDDFLSFLEDDLIPEMERSFPIDRTRRTLFGHSLAGHFALHVLFSGSRLFESYAVSDPSVWWNGRSILTEQNDFIRCAAERRCAIPAALFITVAGGKETERVLGDADAARLALLRSGETGQDVAAALSQMPSLQVEFREFPDQTHATVLPFSVQHILLGLSAYHVVAPPRSGGEDHDFQPRAHDPVVSAARHERRPAGPGLVH